MAAASDVQALAAPGITAFASCAIHWLVDLLQVSRSGALRPLRSSLCPRTNMADSLRETHTWFTLALPRAGALLIVIDVHAILLKHPLPPRPRACDRSKARVASLTDDDTGCCNVPSRVADCCADQRSCRQAWQCGVTSAAMHRLLPMACHGFVFAGMWRRTYTSSWARTARRTSRAQRPSKPWSSTRHSAMLPSSTGESLKTVRGQNQRMSWCCH